MYPEIYSPSKCNLPNRWGRRLIEEIFICRHCQATVSTQSNLAGVQNRNHCPYCLWSRHVDLLHAGDRLSACKAIMEPIGLTVKHRRNKYRHGRDGELMLIHRCSECGRLSINRIAADDLIECLMDIYHNSMKLDIFTQLRLKESGIQLLKKPDHKLVSYQLFGAIQH